MHRHPLTLTPIHTCTHPHIWIYVHVYTYVCMYIRMYVYTYIRIYMYIYMHALINTLDVKHFWQMTTTRNMSGSKNRTL